MFWTTIIIIFVIAVSTYFWLFRRQDAVTAGIPYLPLVITLIILSSIAGAWDERGRQKEFAKTHCVKIENGYTCHYPTNVESE